MYRGQETDHQSGNMISAWLGTCMLRDQGCRLGELGVDHGRSGLPIASLGMCQRVEQRLGTCTEWTRVD